MDRKHHNCVECRIIIGGAADESQLAETAGTCKDHVGRGSAVWNMCRTSMPQPVVVDGADKRGMQEVAGFFGNCIDRGVEKLRCAWRRSDRELQGSAKDARMRGGVERA